MKYNGELKFKNHLLQLTIISKKIDCSTTYPSSQQIGSETQKISDEKKMLLNQCYGSNNITIKPLTQKDSVEVSLESKNNSDITKNNAREERYPKKSHFDKQKASIQAI